MKKLNFYTKKEKKISKIEKNMKKKKPIEFLSFDKKTGHFNSVLNSGLLDTDPKQLVSAKKLIPSMLLADSFLTPLHFEKAKFLYKKKGEN